MDTVDNASNTLEISNWLRPWPPFSTTSRCRRRSSWQSILCRSHGVMLRLKWLKWFGWVSWWILEDHIMIIMQFPVFSASETSIQSPLVCGTMDTRPPLTWLIFHIKKGWAPQTSREVHREAPNEILMAYEKAEIRRFEKNLDLKSWGCRSELTTVLWSLGYKVSTAPAITCSWLCKLWSGFSRNRTLVLVATCASALRSPLHDPQQTKLIKTITTRKRQHQRGY